MKEQIEKLTWHQLVPQLKEILLNVGNGKSAYESWKEQPGNQGKTEGEFLESLKGLSAYEVWEQNGNENKTEDEFLESLKLHFSDLTESELNQLKGEVLDYTLMTEEQKNDLALRVPTNGVVEQGNTQAVSGGEVYDYIDNNILDYTYPIIPKKNNNIDFVNLIEDFLIFSEDVNKTDRKTLWAENITSTSLDLVLYNYDSLNTRTVVGRASVSSVGDTVKIYEVLSASDGVTAVAYVAINGKYLPNLVSVTLDRTQYELDKGVFNINNGEYISFNKNIVKPLFVNGYKKNFYPANTAIRKIDIYNQDNLTNFRLHRFWRPSNNNFVIGIRADNGGTIVDFNYDTRISGTVAPSNLNSHNLILEHSTYKVKIILNIDWTSISNVVTATPTYSEAGIHDINIISKEEANSIKDGLAISTVSSGGFTTLDNPSTLVVLGDGDYSFLEEYLVTNMPEGSYIISSNEVEINGFLDTYLSSSTRYTVRFYGLINTALGLHKHPNMNFEGYGCTLRMGDALGKSYQMCIQPTNGGITPEASRVIDHKYTYIKGFFLDGNQSNNPTANTIYASGICSEIFHEFVEPYTGTQFPINVVCEDITTKDFIRNGIVTGKGWRIRNIDIEYSRSDHGLYIPGGGDVFGENITFRGFFEKGPLSIAGNNKSYQLLKSDNIRLNNVIIDECTGGVWVDIRGQFPNTLYPCNNVLIDGLTIRSTEKRGNRMLVLGSELGPDTLSPTIDNFPKNIEIRNLYADVNINNDLFILSKGQFKVSGRIKVNINRADRAMFFVKGAGDYLLNSVDISGLDIELTGTAINGVFPLFQFDNAQTEVLPLNGLNMNGMTINGNSPYYLFAVRDNSNPNNFVIKNANMNNVIATPTSAINPDSVSKISFITENLVSKLSGTL